jgi:hypothetical protein
VVADQVRILIGNREINPKARISDLPLEKITFLNAKVVDPDDKYLQEIFDSNEQKMILDRIYQQQINENFANDLEFHP